MDHRNISCSDNNLNIENKMIKNVTILGAGESGFGAAMLANQKGHNAVSYTHLTLPTKRIV